MKAKSKIIHLVVDLYPIDFYFYFGKRPSSLKRFVEKHRGITMEGKMEQLSTQHWPATNTSLAITVCLEDLPLDPVTQGLLAHEIFHVAEFALDHVGMHLTDSSSEAYAYLIQFLTEKIYDKLLES